MSDYICLNCGEPCDITEVDFGIGPDEFWGYVSNDVNIQLVSTCCESEYREREFDE